jgi:hypothetical protein
MPISNPAPRPPDARKPREPRTPKTASIPASPHKKRVEGVEAWFQIGATICMVKGWGADALAIGGHAENISEEFVTLGEQDEKVQRAVDFLCNTGPSMALITACLGLGLQLATNHKIIDASNLPGVEDPRILQAEADLMKSKQLAITRAREAEIQAELSEMAAMKKAHEADS